MADGQWVVSDSPKLPAAAPSPSAGAWTVSDSADHPSESAGMPTMHDLASDNSKNEGLYKMKDAQGHVYGIPYSSVEMVDNFRNSFTDEKEAKRYEKDVKYNGPSFGHRMEENLDLSKRNLPKTGKFAHDYLLRPLVNTANRAAATGAGPIVDLVEQATEYPNEQAERAQRDLDSTVAGMSVKEEGKPLTVKSTVRDAGRLLGSSADPVSQVAGRGIEFARDASHSPMDAVTNLAGDVVGMGAQGAVVHGVMKVPGDALETMRNRAGTGAKSTEKLVRDTAAKNDEIIAKGKTEGEKAHADKVQDVRKANEESLKAHDDAVKARNETESKRVDAFRKAAELRTRLHNHIQDIHQSAAKWFDDQYGKLSKLTEGVQVDFSPLVEAVEEGKLQDIVGSDTKVPVFEDILRRAKGEQGAGGEKPDNWKEMADDEKAEWSRKNANDRGIGHKDLTGYWRELGKIVKSSKDADVRTAAVKVRGVIEKMQREVALKADAEAAAKAARDHKPKPPSAAQLDYSLSQKYRNFAESYRDSGSVGTKAANADNAVEATKPFLEAKTEEELSDLKKQVVGREAVTEGKRTNATEWAGRNSAEDTAGKLVTRSKRRAQTEKLIDQTRKAHEDLKGLGKPQAPPEPPELKAEPEYTPPEPETLSPEDLKRYKREQLNKRIDQLERSGGKIGFGGLSNASVVGYVSHLLGVGTLEAAGVGLASAGAAMLGPKIFARILKMPGVAESLTAITKADVEVLEKLPANQRIEAEQAVINLTQQAKMQGVIPQNKPTPLAAFAKQDMVKAKAEVAKAAETPKPEPPPEEPPPTSAQPKSGSPPTSPPTLPGMEGAVAEQGAAADAHKAETGKQEVEASLVAPKDDISRATGEMERSSPLFRDSEASGQGGLFIQPQAEPRNSTVPSRRLEDLKVDPKRFQYKLGGNKAGVTDALSDAKWDQALADPIHIWEDPEDGNEYVVNGHHRYELASQAGAERIDISPIDNTKIKTAAEAREFGAMKNIADGNGTSVDAAKFFREKGLKPEDLAKRGLGLKKSVANEGVALSRLSDDLFNRVVDGKIDPKIGAAIGDASEVESDQEAILKDVQRREKQGRPVSAEQIRESARLIKQAPTFSQTTQDLFGNHEEDRNLFLEMGEVSEYIQKELADEKRVFGRIATKGASEQLAKGENVINPAKNKEISTRAAQLRELYMKRSAQAGPINAALQEAAERLAEGGKPNEIKQSALEEIREHLDDELRPVD